MKLLTNTRNRRTTIALAGLGLHLEPRGSVGDDGKPTDCDLVLDEEMSDPAIVALLAAGIIIASDPEPTTPDIERTPAQRRAHRRSQKSLNPSPKRGLLPSAE